MYTLRLSAFLFFFFFNDTATTEIYTLSLHDALPICPPDSPRPPRHRSARARSAAPEYRPDRSAGRRRASRPRGRARPRGDRKSTRLNSSHLVISYAVFCLKKKTNCATVINRVALTGH